MCRLYCLPVQFFCILLSNRSLSRIRCVLFVLQVYSSLSTAGISRLSGECLSFYVGVLFPAGVEVAKFLIESEACSVSVSQHKATQRSVERILKTHKGDFVETVNQYNIYQIILRDLCKGSAG